MGSNLPQSCKLVIGHQILHSRKGEGKGGKEEGYGRRGSKQEGSRKNAETEEEVVSGSRRSSSQGNRGDTLASSAATELSQAAGEEVSVSACSDSIEQWIHGDSIERWIHGDGIEQWIHGDSIEQWIHGDSRR